MILKGGKTFVVADNKGVGDGATSEARALPLLSKDYTKSLNENNR